MDDDAENAPRDKRVGVESAAAMAVAGAALVPDRPYIGVIVAGLAPGAVNRIMGGRQRKSDAAAAVTLAEASHVSGLNPRDLAEACESDDRKSMLAGDVLQAAYSTLYAAKLIALGRCLANGVTDDTRLDVEWVVARALASVEEPQVLVLREMVEGRSSHGPVNKTDGTVADMGHVWTVADLTDRLPRLSLAVDPLLATLNREGMSKGVPARSYGGIESGTPFFEVTSFGRDVLRRIREASEPTE
jgi:hypothetical protein